MRWKLLMLPFMVISGLVACSDGPGAPVIEVSLITPAGDNPAQTNISQLQVELTEGDTLPQRFDAPVMDGTFDFPVSVEMFDETLSIRTQLKGPGALLSGAPPLFKLGVTGGLVRFAMQAPGACEALQGVRLASASGRSFVRNDTFLFSFPDEVSNTLSFVDLLRLETGEFELPRAIPASRGVALSSVSTLLVADDGSAVIFNPGDTAAPLIDVPLHDGAGVQSTLVSRGALGAAVIGGEATTGVTWVSAEGGVTRTDLLTERANPSALWLGRDLMIVGGGGSVEVANVSLPVSTAKSGVEDLLDRRGPLTKVDANIAWFNSESERQLWLAGCPEACTVVAEQNLSLSNPVVDGVLLFDGLSVYQLADEGYSESLDLQLSSDGAAITTFSSGVVLTAGGVSDDKAVQICSPSAIFFE